MNPVLVLLRKDFALFFRDRASLSLTFVVPFALIYLFGQIYHVNSSDPGPAGIPVAVVNESDNPAAARLVDALRAEKAFRVLTTFVNSDKSARPLAEGDLETVGLSLVRHLYREYLTHDRARTLVIRERTPEEILNGHRPHRGQ